MRNTSFKIISLFFNIFFYASRGCEQSFRGICCGCRPKFCIVPPSKDGSIFKRNSSAFCSKRGKNPQTKPKQIIHFNLLFTYFFPYKHITSGEKCVYSESFPTISLCFERKLRMLWSHLSAEISPTTLNSRERGKKPSQMPESPSRFWEDDVKGNIHLPIWAFQANTGGSSSEMQLRPLRVWLQQRQVKSKNKAVWGFFF